jgi:hypothetical protein
VLVPGRASPVSWPSLLLRSLSMVRLMSEAAHRLLEEALLARPAGNRKGMDEWAGGLENSQSSRKYYGSRCEVQGRTCDQAEYMQAWWS